MHKSKRIPLSLKIVSILFILAGTSAIIQVILSLMAPPPTNLERTLTLSTSSGDEVVNPTDKQIYEALSAVDASEL